MMEVPLSLLGAFVTGVISGILVSIPVGPINVTIIHEGAERGFKWSLFTGAGAVLMEAIYCAIGFAGFTDLFTTQLAKAAFQLTSFCLMAFLGTKYMFAKEITAESRSAAKMMEKLHPHTAFWTGFIRTLGNPGVLLMWIALAATFTAHEWVGPTYSSKGMCVLGMMVGGMTWFSFLAYLISISHRHISDTGMLWISRVAGAGLLGTAIVIGFKLAVMIVKGN